jgi:branched-chain amino acid transport system permease protein
VPPLISAHYAAPGALAAPAGELQAPLNDRPLLTAIGILNPAFPAAAVGGSRTRPRAILVGMLLGTTESLGAGYLSGAYKDIYAFLLLIFVLMVKPSGLFGVDTRMKA